MAEENKIISHIIEIKQHLGNIDSHLKELNGRTGRNQEEIDTERDRLNKLEKMVSHYVGGAAIGAVLISFVIQMLIKHGGL